MASGSWTSLEVVKLLVGVLGPVAVALLGWYLSRAVKRVEAAQWANQTLITRRLDLYAQIAPRLNALYCFFEFVGTWKDVTPRKAIELKRELDEIMFSQAILFSPALLEAYRDLMNAMFLTFRTVDRDALVRAAIECTYGNRRSMKWWTEDMAEMFATADDSCGSQEFRTRHDRLNDLFRADLQVTRPAIMG